MALRWADLSLRHIRIGSKNKLWIWLNGKCRKVIHGSNGLFVVVVLIAFIGGIG
jgi:hypothetical protein